MNKCNYRLSWIQWHFGDSLSANLRRLLGSSKAELRILRNAATEQWRKQFLLLTLGSDYTLVTTANTRTGCKSGTEQEGFTRESGRGCTVLLSCIRMISLWSKKNRKRSPAAVVNEEREPGPEVERTKRNSSGREGAAEGVKRHSSVMSAGCCGTKKQKTGCPPSCDCLDDSSGCCSGGSSSSGSSSALVPHPTNGHVKHFTVAHPEMGFYCFDVLYSHLHSVDLPKAPRFTNDEQWAVVYRVYLSTFMSCILTLAPFSSPGPLERIKDCVVA